MCSTSRKGGSMRMVLIKMTLVILIISSITTYFKKEFKKDVVIENHIVNNLAFTSILSFNNYEIEIIEEDEEEEIVYEDLTLTMLSDKLDKVLSSNLKDYGSIIASLSLEKEVDPMVATSIILVETGCLSKCSSLVRQCNNVGGMKGTGCGNYAKFSSLEAGINSFITNLSKNYYQKGLNTPELINRKYASNPNWYKNVYYYMNLIKAS